MFSGIICGNLGGDCETKRLDSGDTVVEFNVAVKTSIKKEDPPTWVRCSLWGKRGEKLTQYLTKGTKVVVRGSVTSRPYISKKNGEPGAGLELRVDDVELAGGGERHEAKPAARQDDDSIPF